MDSGLEALELRLTPWEGRAKPHVVRIGPTTIADRRFCLPEAAPKSGGWHAADK